MVQIQESIEVNSEIGTGMEWLFEQEEPSNSLNEEQIKEVAAEIENEEFEPLKPFEGDERSIFSPFKHR